MFYIQKHSYTDFECEFFTQEIYMKYNLTTGNYEPSLHQDFYMQYNVTAGNYELSLYDY